MTDFDLTQEREKRKVILGQYPSIFGKSLSGLLYLVAAPEMLLHHYVGITGF